MSEKFNTAICEHCMKKHERHVFSDTDNAGCLPQALATMFSHDERIGRKRRVPKAKTSNWGDHCSVLAANCRQEIGRRGPVENNNTYAASFVTKECAASRDDGPMARDPLVWEAITCDPEILISCQS
jgi:hypothetical protein